MERIAPSGFDVALVEKQPTNRQMIRVESMIAMYLQLAGGKDARAVVYSPVHKLKGVEGSAGARGRGKRQYAARKRLSIEATMSWLAEHPQPDQHLVQRFHASSKRDDFADSLMQALSYAPPPPQLQPQPQPRAVRARKPTEGQLKKQCFSLPNLKWLIGEALKRPAAAGTVECFEEPDHLLLTRLANDRLVGLALRKHKLTAPQALAEFGFCCAQKKERDA
ncbi:hypothetical protein COO60DRAFT_1643804 [Scenedesmus sp. NREL 46B-D3]|nr:hypothetical protein COO60DRAFT_1643804 [Scenedesmus sp. NREL 46B-D3]